MTGKRDAAEDILQTVFLKYYENMDKIKNPERAPQWIYTVARNEIYQHMRNKYKATITYIESEDENRSEADLESELERKEISQMVKDEIEQLSHDHKEVILLKEISGLSYKEIAQILNITEDLVKSRLFKARKKLSEKLLKTF